MAYEVKDMSGSLFAAKDKKTDKHPDREGSAKIDGKDYWVSGWVKQDRNGKPWLSLSFKPKEEQRRATPASAPQGRRGSMKPDDSEVPF